ncbi:hypothetical protein EhV269 [Emiliania huxleyi virus 86]|uniref:Uncharacterized protein n=1 Tax=Emiliania huxleyi virus 86 (isolate United Kingdom/English Channel/1999) TaxID=654925 RepID=Q4A2L3_EHV8U|nr:hypothetical protein EhV269 [Emiliania huxleyi virus 86]AEO97720.1 hypothetical protein ENVG_00326 [Emiliania huxleyi virus 84]AEP15355.1 hypothetical protein EOVG_00418 [Emiliania huxleyi virus 88]AHA54878.1 hypothetical protein EhV145_00328 [Emiliania huxleyi virus 145]CAI65693.1 hypothetical protein EhV269 [Emiliania huxleyi virus 86]
MLPSQIDDLPYDETEISLIKTLDFKTAADLYRARRVALGLWIEPPLDHSLFREKCE